MEHKQKLIYAMVFVSLAIVACGMSTASVKSPILSAAPVPVKSDNKDAYIITDMSADVNMVACRVDAELGGLRVRPAPGDLSTYSKVLASGESVTVREKFTVTEDMGLWAELVDGGWVNARYLCEEK